MFVSLPSRRKPPPRWAAPLLFAALWLAFLWMLGRPDEARRSLWLAWGALGRGLGSGDPSWGAWIAALQDGSVLRLFTALFLHAVVAIDDPHRAVIGASGAVAAVVGAYLALFPGARVGVVLPLGLFLEFVRAPAFLLIGIWAALQVVFAYIGPAFGAVAWAAH